MSAKNKPTYELFCKGIMNRKRKGLRFDENGNVVCETNAEFGADVEVDGSLIINSAKDLKTKDGTSFGGGGLPSPWVVNENILGYEDTENQLMVGFLAEGGNLYGYQNKQSGEVSYVSPASSSTPNIIVYLNVNTQVESAVVLPDNFMTKSQEINLGDIDTNKAEIAKKQSTLYRHTITILKLDGSDKHLLVMTHQSESNLKIDSIQDLITVFKGTSLSCICTHEMTIHISDAVDDIYINNVTHSRIDIGNTLAEMFLYTASDLEQEPFTDVFETTGFTITDTVTAM